MQVGADALAAIANHWLARFERALADGAEPELVQLFHDEAHWRDVLAFGWRLRTVSGASAIAGTLRQEARTTRATGFRTDPERTPPRHATRAGTKCVEAIFRFE